MPSINYSQLIGTDPAEAATVHRLYGHPVCLIVWEDGRSELVDGTVAELTDDIAFRLEDEGVSARFTIRLAEPWEIDAFVDAANETIGLSFG